jgi:hypothetical protein
VQVFDGANLDLSGGTLSEAHRCLRPDEGYELARIVGTTRFVETERRDRRDVRAPRGPTF